jgi:hypothetical protein
MQTLRLLGVQVLGEKFPRHCDGEEFNPNGYWDLPLEQTIRGIRNSVPSDAAVKLIGRMFTRSTIRGTDKVLVCIRDKYDVIRSTMRIDDYSGLEAALMYDASYGAILNRLPQVNHLFVVYEKALMRPESYVRDIASFVGKQPNDTAVSNITKEKVWR